ncbi:MAG: carboxypeptidase-like regulatory domain-containing protein, partial [Actinobacteria bacterium]|nr:carboxypeptidase-like regulatory domain-containing protein [Actinomycetota bacterium]
MTPRLRLRLCLLTALVTAVGACTTAEVEPLPPPKKVPVTTTTTAIDFSAVGLPGVPGRTTTTVALGPGRASLSGTLAGPDGPVSGGVVRVERLVGEGRASIEVTTGPDGRYSVPKILGGRYRVRGWKAAPDNLALLEPVVFFLEGSERRVVDLTVSRYQGLAVSAAIAPDPPVVGEVSSLVVQLVDQAVDASGIVRATPLPATPAELTGSGDWRLQSPNPVSADSSGRVRWLLECRRVGTQPIAVVVSGSATFNLDLPACVAPPPIEDPAAPGPT